MKLRLIFGAFFFILFSLSSLGQNRINFFHLTPKLENENILIKNTVQDNLGYIWMSHKEGITKYDGYDFSYYSYETIFNKKPLKDVVKNIAIDKSGCLWVLTFKGYTAKRSENGEFTTFTQKFSSNKPSSFIQTIFTKDDKIWFASKNGTIYLKIADKFKIDSITSINSARKNSIILDLDITKKNELIFSTNKGTIYKYSIPNKSLEEIKGPFSNYPGIVTISLDRNDNLWIGTENLGLFHYDLKKRSLIEHSSFKNKQNRLIHDRFLSLFCDSSGIIWAGSDGEGLYKINPNTGDINFFKNNLSDKFSIGSNSIIDINEDSNQNLWVVGNYGDLNILPIKKSNIFYHQGSAKKVPVRVLCMLKSTNGTLWIGTDGNGLTKVEPYSKKEIQTLTYGDSNEGFYIQTLEEDKDKNIWIGTYKNGLWFYDYKKEKFSKIQITNSKGIQATNIENVFKDSKNRIWVGSNLSVDIFLNKEKKIASFPFGEKGLYGDLPRSIIEDSNKNIWIGVDRSGLFKFKESSTNIQESAFQQHLQTNKGTKPDYSITAMAATTDGKLWLLDQGKLAVFNTIDNSLKEYIDFEPFSDAFLIAILLETDDNLWLSSTKGIWNFKAKDSIVKRYYKTDGFQDDFFIHESAYKDDLGNLYFGGLYGLNRFHPNMISKSETITNINISDIEILNKSASLILPEQTQEGIEKVNTLKLKHNQSSFSFRFSVIGNILNSNYFYTYRLKGFNDEWISSNNDRAAVYTNISPGNYTFEVKAGTKKGNWDIPSKNINIHIKEPIWNQRWAYFIYFIIIGLSIYGIFKWVLLNNNLLAERLENSHEKELYALKMNFFAKMSHEIQTPLTLIEAPIEDMLKRMEGSENLLLKQRLKMIANNTSRLSRITNELTTLRNKELGQLKLKVSKKDIIYELKKITESFEEQARFKKIDFQKNHFQESYNLWFDSDKIEHIVYNFFSNAFKFTPREGEITLETKLHAETKMLEISIKDNGFGISKQDQENIFKLFYQTTNGAEVKGSGIGLALVKELVHLHKGEILVDSKFNKGSKFTILLPIDENVYSDKEKIIPKPDSVSQLQENNKQTIELFNEIKTTTSKVKNTLLIVEDNFEMQYFLQDIFSKFYNVLVADNGKEGLELAEKSNPNIIISDITMPIMNGLKMCKALKKNKKTSHIPIILLTARNTTKTKIKGLEHGAIEFINKPFNIKELFLKTHNILTTQEKAFSNFKSELISSPKERKIKSKDTLFLEKLTETLNEEMRNPNFKLENLSEIFNMSYSVIYRKCQTLTGKTVVDFFRLIRLKKSAILLSQSGYTVSEVSFIIGFNDPQYFSNCFKKQFGKTPNSFKKEAKTTDLNELLSKYKLNDYSQDTL